MREVQLGLDGTLSRGGGSERDHRPPQAHHGESRSLEASGIAHKLATSGRYGSLPPRVLHMDRVTQVDEIRRQITSRAEA